MKDPYETLGVAKTASADEIRSAYRKLAKKLHPDLNPGDKQAEERFKEVAAANDLLSDPEKRRRFDVGEIDASGAEKAPPNARYYRDYAQEGGHPYSAEGAYGDFAQGDDLFAELLRRSAEQARRRPGADLHYELPVDFLDAVNGATKTITLPQGGTLDVTIPSGVEDGQILRLRGKGAPRGEGPPGDALVQIVVKPHRYFTREGDDILLDLPISVKEAALGAEVRTPTTTGSVMLKIPKRSNTGDVLRLRGKGVKTRARAGDELVKLKVMMPTEAEPELDAFLADWKPAGAYDPRKEM
jgi:DnaJ-class molecular chaperone